MEKIAKLEATVAAVAAAGKAPTVHGDNAVVTQTVIGAKTTNNIRNEITVNLFGQENVDHIDRRAIYDVLTRYPHLSRVEAAGNAIQEAVGLIYSDPDRPENLTCYIPNKKTNEVLVHGANGWEVRPAEQALTPMLQKGVEVLFAKQPYGDPSEGLPADPDLRTCGEVLNSAYAYENDARLHKRMVGNSGILRAILVRNKGFLIKSQ